MADEAKQKVRAELRNAQAAFERAEVQRDGDGPSVTVEQCLHVLVVAGCGGTEETRVCAAPMGIPVAACTDPATAAKYGETCATNGAFGALVGGVVGKNIAAAITGASLNCGTALIAKAIRNSGNEDLANTIESAGIAWDVADILCSASRKC